MPDSSAMTQFDCKIELRFASAQFAGPCQTPIIAAPTAFSLRIFPVSAAGTLAPQLRSRFRG
jgi:hypothetical protein